VGWGRAFYESLGLAEERARPFEAQGKRAAPLRTKEHSESEWACAEMKRGPERTGPPN
jgi:hypothetical protein